MFDILIKGASIVDGTGTPGWVGDVGIKDGRFTAIDHHIDGEARHQVGAEGLTLAPGFIDIHSHFDAYLLSHPQTEIKLRQGVVLDVIGNCGISLAPLDHESGAAVIEYVRGVTFPSIPRVDWLSFSEYANRLEKSGLSINVAAMVGHGTLRTAAMGLFQGAPDAGQMSHMKALLAQAMEEGALGMSTGLAILPGCYSKTEELIDLATLVGQKSGIYVSHVRNEAQDILLAIKELTRIGWEAQIPVHISHMKVSGPSNWTLADDLVEMLESARAEGLDITFDLYPYRVLSMTMLTLLPPWAREGGVRDIMLRLRNPRQRDRIIGHIVDGITGWENVYHNAGWDKIVVCKVQSEERRAIQGKSVAQLASETEQDPFELVLDLLTAEKGCVRMFAESMNEENVMRFLSLPFSIVSSDGNPIGEKPHPRVYGTFPRIIRRYVRELGVLSLQEAIKKMSWLPAQRLGLRDLGAIKDGFKANVVLFDARTFADTATYEDPCRLSEGLSAVIVNGEMVIDGPAYTGATPGQFIRGQTSPEGLESC